MQPTFAYKHKSLRSNIRTYVDTVGYIVQYNNSIRTYVRMKSTIRTYAYYIRTYTKMHSDICPFDNKQTYVYIHATYINNLNYILTLYIIWKL